MRRKEIILLYRNLEKKFKYLHKKFPSPEYDVILGRIENYAELQRIFPEFRGWDRIKPKFMRKLRKLA